jgi:hypothetical protein
MTAELRRRQVMGAPDQKIQALQFDIEAVTVELRRVFEASLTTGELSPSQRGLVRERLEEASPHQPSLSYQPYHPSYHTSYRPAPSTPGGGMDTTAASPLPETPLNYAKDLQELYGYVAVTLL